MLKEEDVGRDMFIDTSKFNYSNFAESARNKLDSKTNAPVTSFSNYGNSTIKSGAMSDRHNRSKSVAGDTA